MVCRKGGIMRTLRLMVFSLVLWVIISAQVLSPAEKSGGVELLTYYQTHPFPFWVWNPPDPAVDTRGETGTFATLHVSPSKGTKAIILEIDMAANFSEATTTIELSMLSHLYLNVLSNDIPANVKVDGAILLASTTRPQDGVRPALPMARINRVVKFLMEASEESIWGIWNTDTDEYLPPNEQQALLKKLIKNGFDIEINFRNWMKGVSEVTLAYVNIFAYGIDFALKAHKVGTEGNLGKIHSIDAVIR